MNRRISAIVLDASALLKLLLITDKGKLMGSRTGRCWILAISALLALAAAAFAAPPEDVTYQGRLLDSVG